MRLSEDKIIEVFFDLDEFFRSFQQSIKPHLLGKAAGRKPTMSQSEVACIAVLYHQSGYRCLKHFYLFHVRKYLNHLFPRTVSYSRFVELLESITLPMAVFAAGQHMQAEGPIYFCDSTPLRVCNNKRIPRHKVFDGLAARGKSTMGYFYGFKLHLICDSRGRLANFCLTPANVDDRTPLKNGLADQLIGRMYGDKGYVSQELFEQLWQQGLSFVTTIRKNMKNKLLLLSDKLLQRKRSLIETINDQLKNICDMEHSRHRSFHNFFNNLTSGIIAYSYMDKLPEIKLTPEQYSLFL